MQSFNQPPFGKNQSTAIPQYKQQLTMSSIINIEDHEVFKRISVPTESESKSSIKHQKAVTRKGDEVFFAINSSIRVSKVGSSSSYKLLDTQNKIKFSIQGLKINSSGNLLAVYNEHNVIIVSLPTSSSINNKDQTLIPTKSFVVASELYSNTEILEVLWNKASRYDSNVVILSSDGFVRSFDPRFSLEKPDLAYDLTSGRFRNVGLNNDVSENPVSIAFGATDTLANMLTLYVLDRDGDVFALYPFLPRELSASKDQIEELLNTTIVLAKDIESNGKILEKSNVVNQLRFVMSLWNQVDTSERELRGEKVNHVFKCENTMSTSLQGPFSMSPYPDLLYETTTTSLTVVDCEYTNVLAIGFEQGGYLLLAPKSELFMKWDNEFSYETEEDEAPALLSIEYGKSKNAGKSFVSSFLEKFNFILQSGAQVFKVDLSKFHKLYKQEFESSMSEDDSNDISPVLVSLYTLQTKEEIEAVSSFVDDYNTTTTFVVTNWNARSLTSEPETNERLYFDEEDSQTNPPRLYQPQLGVPYLEIQNLLTKISSLKIKVPSEGKVKLTSTESLLSNLNKASSQVSSYLIDFHKISIQMNHKLDKQKTEFERQIQETNNLTEMLELIETTKIENHKSIETYVEKQKQLEERCNKLSESLEKISKTPLSVQEKKWFKEIGDTARNFNKYAHQTDQWRKQLQYMKKALEEKKKMAKKNEDLIDNQFELLNNQMLEAKKYLK